MQKPNKREEKKNKTIDQKQNPLTIDSRSSSIMNHENCKLKLNNTNDQATPKLQTTGTPIMPDKKTQENSNEMLHVWIVLIFFSTSQELVFLKVELPTWYASFSVEC